MDFKKVEAKASESIARVKEFANSPAVKQAEAKVAEEVKQPVRWMTYETLIYIVVASLVIGAVVYRLI